MAGLKQHKGKSGRADCLTLDEFVERIYIPHAKARKRSWSRDERIIGKHISPRFGNVPLAWIRSGDVEDWHNKLLESGLAPGSCNYFLAIFKTVFAIAESRGYISPGTAPCRTVRNFKTGLARARFLSREEGALLMRKLAESQDIRARALQLIMLTGARKNEILKASWDCVDFSMRMLKVPISKGGRTRYIMLSEPAIAILKKLGKKGKWLFPGRNPDKPINDIFIFWNRIRNELGLSDVRIHDLRHTFASYLVNGGHSLYKVQRLLGHADSRTTMRYAHLENESLLTATEDVGKVLASRNLN